MIRNLDREFDLQKIGRINRYASDRAPMQQAGRSNLFAKPQTRIFSKIPNMNYRNYITLGIELKVLWTRKIDDFVPQL